jgi:hypothetical protein
MFSHNSNHLNRYILFVPQNQMLFNGISWKSVVLTHEDFAEYYKRFHPVDNPAFMRTFPGLLKFLNSRSIYMPFLTDTILINDSPPVCFGLATCLYTSKAPLKPGQGFDFYETCVCL